LLPELKLQVNRVTEVVTLEYLCILLSRGIEALAWDIQNRASCRVGAPPARRPRHRGGHDGGAGAMSPPPTRCARVGAALTASDQEGVIATCRSMMAPWAIERAERARQQQGEGGIAGGRENGGE
jgi:hypothetical protein